MFLTFTWTKHFYHLFIKLICCLYHQYLFENKPKEKKTHLKSHLYNFVPVYVPPVWQIESFEDKKTHFGGVHTSAGCWCRTCIISLSPNIYHINMSARSGETFVFRATVFIYRPKPVHTDASAQKHAFTQLHSSANMSEVWMFQAGV